MTRILHRPQKHYESVEEHLAPHINLRHNRVANDSARACAHILSPANELYSSDNFHSSSYDPKTGRNYSIDG